MIDTKYGLKYPMPHSVVHIVDNSVYTGPLPVTVADDPSLYSTIVVTGTPMGEDNKVVSITRSDVVNLAYGIGNLTGTDRAKYGQTIDYPVSLLEQGAPVRLLRVTPEGSTYGFSCILVQWRIDETDHKMHVRFKEAGMPLELNLARFQNTKRLNETLVRQFKNDAVVDGEYTWKQRVFMTNISAGRGKAYNYMSNAINPTIQAKRPANVKYEFVTIDTRTNSVCERFYASLVNTNTADRTDAIESVNVVVGKRLEGSSIIVPYVNESVIHEVYKEYMEHFETMLEIYPTDEAAKNAYVALNVNIFDILYGDYIYNGSDVGTPLPFYQVDMLDTDIASLPSTNRISTNESTFVAETPEVLYNKIKPLMYGIDRDGDSVYIGNVYLSSTTNTTMNPTLTIVGAINQYTGAVTNLTIPKVYPMDTTGQIQKTTIDGKDAAVVITTVFNDVVDVTKVTESKTLKNMVAKGTLVAGNVVAFVKGEEFTLYTVLTANKTTTSYTLSQPYSSEDVYNAIAWNSHTSGSAGIGNIIGRTTEDAAYNRVGGTVIENGVVYVNDYTYPSSKTRIKIENAKMKFGTCPTEVNITTDIVGASYDVLVYPDDKSKTTWTVTNAEIVNGGTNYRVGDEITVTNSEGNVANTKFTVTGVNIETGEVTSISFEGSTEVADIAGDAVVTSCTEVRDPMAEGLTIKITTSSKVTYEGVPSKIQRYIVSGTLGSIFNVSVDPTPIPANYYSDEHGLNLESEVGGVRIKHGSTGFFDDETMNNIEFKWRYSALLVKAYRGEIDPRIMSPTRTPAKYLFDGGHNTIVGQTILPYLTYAPSDIINASTIFTADEKEEIMFYPEIIANITEDEDIDVKQAMYDLMVYRCYQGIPEEKRPVGPGSGLSLHLDSGITDANTAMLINTSFTKRFDNPNASWDIGGWVDSATGNSYTFTKRLVDNLIRHCKETTVNKPYVGKYTTITNTEYSSYFPDIDTTDWDLRELLYNSGGNAWIADINGNLTRRSQRTLLRNSETSDLVQESNMRTLSQLVYILQNKIDEYLLEYNDDGVLKTLSDEVNNMFSKWVGRLVDGLEIIFERDINIDGGEIIVCYCNVTFRGLILRVPIIVNVNRRDS